MADICGIVLAAGAGTRAGAPKALLRMPGGQPWLVAASTALLDGGCDRVVVVLGAEAALASRLLPDDDRVTSVVATQWERGMSESLRTGLAAASGDATLITLVDLPTLPAAVVRRMLAAAGPLRQAVFGGRPGHPVYIAADHWAAAAASLSGDRGARDYLVANGVEQIECGDLWDGDDRDEG